MANCKSVIKDKSGFQFYDAFMRAVHMEDSIVWLGPITGKHVSKFAYFLATEVMDPYDEFGPSTSQVCGTVDVIGSSSVRVGAQVDRFHLEYAVGTTAPVNVHIHLFGERSFCTVFDTDVNNEVIDARGVNACHALIRKPCHQLMLYSILHIQ